MKRANECIAVAAVGAAGVLAILLTSASQGLTEVPPDYRDIAAHLVQRGQSSQRGNVSFRQYKFVTQPAAFDELSAILLQSQTVAMAGVRDAAEQWVNNHLPAERETWVGTMAYRDDTWKAQRIRMPELDTAHASVALHASAANMKPAPMAHDEITHVVGNDMTVIKDSRALIRTERSGHRHPAVPMDISLASWQEAIDQGASVEGQEILASVDGAAHSMLYINHHDDGTWGAGEYIFRDDLDWAPSAFRSFDDTGTDAQIVYGYDLSVSMPLRRPAVVAQGELLESGELDVVIWVIDSWSESCSAGQVLLRLPPVRLEVDYLISPNDPLVAMHEPEYLVNIDACHKPVVAVTSVVLSIGTESQSTDFDCDGYVTFDDVDSAINLFYEAGEDP